MDSLETYRFDFLNAIGQSPETFDWIGGQTFTDTAGNKVPLTGVHSVNNHELSVGAWVNLVSNNTRYTGKFQVRAIGADDGTYKESIFCIAVVKQAGELASGTWQRSEYVTPTGTDPGANNNKPVDTTGTTGLFGKTGVTVAGKTFTYTAIVSTIIGLVMVGFALAYIPAKNIPTKIEIKN